MTKTSCFFAVLLAAGTVACGDKAPPPAPPKPKVEAAVKSLLELPKAIAARAT